MEYLGTALILTIPTKLTVEEVKTIVWRYTFAYYNTKRVTAVNPDGLPPLVYRKTAAKKSAA